MTSSPVTQITDTQPWRYITLILRLFLALVFLVAGFSKVTQPWTFVHTVEGYNMLPTALARPFGLALPWIEVMLGIYLLIGLFIRITAVAVVALLAVFLVALAVQIGNGHTGNCGCVLGINNPLVTAFVGGNDIGIFDLVRDGLLLLFALALFVTPRPLLAVDALLHARRTAEEDMEYAEDTTSIYDARASAS